MTGVSAQSYDETIVELFKLIQPTSVLDIGPGWGKYARLVKRAEVNARTIALEIDATYVDSFGLRDLYDEVRIGDAAELVNKPEARNDLFDCVVIGDCIEHMPKSRGLDLLNFLTYRTGWIIVVAPEFYYYATGEHEPAEAHISCWSEFDFQWHDRFAYMRAEFMQLFLLRGYQPSPISLEHLVGRINANPPRVTTIGGEDLKPAHLTLFTRDRNESFKGNIFNYRQA